MLVTSPPAGGLQSPCIALNQSYPAALAEHLAVVASKELFLDTLTKFHLALGTRIVIPKMGGKDLDLHTLYVEVTQRGGLQQVIKDRKWKEITGAFDFPRTTTSASFVLRKYYITLLHHYEQLYFFGSRGLLVAPPTPLSAPSFVPVKQIESAPAPEPQAEKPKVINTGGKRIRKRRLAPLPVMAPGEPIAAVGNVVTGTIEGKFEHGYLVTVVVGSEKLRGVIYHAPPGHVRGPQHADIPSFMLSSRVVGDVKLPLEPAKGRKRKQREEMKKDPNAPRSSRTGYNFFFAEERAKLKLKFPEKERELSRMIGDAWNSLTEEQKLPYQERGAKDRERYEKEMRDYRLLKSSTNTTLPEFARPGAANAEVRDHQVESKSTTASVPAIPRQFILDPCQLVNSSQSETQCVQQGPQHHFGSSHPSCTETLPVHAAADAAHEKVGSLLDTPPVARQFMN